MSAARSTEGVMEKEDKPEGITGSEARKMWLAASRVSYIGIFFGVAIVIGFFSGRWLDSRWHTTPWLSLVGLLIGIASGFRELIRIAMRFQRESGREQEEQQPK
jgi:F0F1-type ATP synthase assembly protein I